MVVPGSLDRPTGGDRYDARMVAGLRNRGWKVAVHGLKGEFPGTEVSAGLELDEALDGLPTGSRVLVDGLVMGGLPGPVRRHSDRLRLLALIHHPLADETGLSKDERDGLTQSEERALEVVTGVVVTSRHTAGRVEEGYRIPTSRIRVAIPGTDPAPAAEGPPSGEPPALLCLGSVIPRKGHDVLIAALGRLRDLPWSLICAGSVTSDPAFVRTVKRSARDAGIAHRVRFPGELSEPAVNRLFHSSSVFVLPTRYEGYGMALAEALARGLPIVTTTGGAVPETVPPEAGILVPPGDPEALASALGPLLEPAGAERRRELARAARKHGVRLLTWEDAAATLERAILELTDPEKGRTA